MSRNIFRNKLIKCECAGFIAVIVLIWIDEIGDLPHWLFGAQSTPVNVVESSMETVFILLLGVAILTATHRLLHHLKHLEGFIVVCSYCKYVRIDEKWVPIEQYIRENSDVIFSHSLCPECARKHYDVSLPSSKTEIKPS